METVPIENRVASSNLVSIDLEEYLDKGPRIPFDIKDLLTEGILLREKDFRARVKALDFSIFEGKNVAVFCSTEALIPSWAHMLLVSKFVPYASQVVIGSMEDLEKSMISEAISQIDIKSLKDAKVVVKGCGDIKNRDYAYGEITKKLVPIVSSLMYGEPCSTVPVFKKPRD